jgi:hypothetical protein
MSDAVTLAAVLNQLRSARYTGPITIHLAQGTPKVVEYSQMVRLDKETDATRSTVAPSDA